VNRIPAETLAFKIRWTNHYIIPVNRIISTMIESMKFVNKNRRKRKKTKSWRIYKSCDDKFSYIYFTRLVLDVINRLFVIMTRIKSRWWTKWRHVYYSKARRGWGARALGFSICTWSSVVQTPAPFSLRSLPWISFDI
jgi:hypothetical protein